MKAIVCEMCGSQDLIKQDGMYVCRNCGTKYTVEEAKKLLGTVKIDKSEELSNALELARRAKSENNSVDAVKYYCQVLAAEPNNWEAYFYTRYYSARNTTIGNIGNSATTLANSIDNTLKLVKELPESNREQIIACINISTSIHNLSTFFVTNISNQASNFSDRTAWKSFVNKHTRGINFMDINLADGLLRYFDNEDTKRLAVQSYQSVLALDAEYDGLSDAERKSIQEKINALDPSYTPSVPSPPAQTPPAPTPTASSTKQSSGCYVATAIYGSYDCPQVWTLRRYRDYTLTESWYGRAFIRTYYAVSPTLVKWFGNTEWFRNLWKPKLDKMVQKLNNEGVDNTPYSDRNW